MKLAEKIKTYGLSFLLMLAPKSAGAQDMQPKASTPEDSVSVNVNIPQITSLIRHQIHNNFTDVPTAEEKDSAIAVPIINMAQYAKDGSVEVKLAHPHDICAPNIDDAMRYVECKTGKQPFNFEQYFKCLPEDEQARFKDLPAFAQTKYRIDCEKYYNDKNNFHNVAAYHNNVRRYIKARKGPNSEWIKKVHRLGPNQADKTIFANGRFVLEFAIVVDKNHATTNVCVCANKGIANVGKVAGFNTAL